jgi:hypothetical protein
VIFLEMPSVSELSLANLHHVLGLYRDFPPSSPNTTGATFDARRPPSHADIA